MNECIVAQFFLTHCVYFYFRSICPNDLEHVSHVALHLNNVHQLFTKFEFVNLSVPNL